MYEYDIPPRLHGKTVHCAKGALRLDHNLPQADRRYLAEQLQYPLLRRKIVVRDKPTPKANISPAPGETAPQDDPIQKS